MKIAILMISLVVIAVELKEKICTMMKKIDDIKNIVRCM